jgi:hypothetical protein
MNVQNISSKSRLNSKSDCKICTYTVYVYVYIFFTVYVCTYSIVYYTRSTYFTWIMLFFLLETALKTVLQDKSEIVSSSLHYNSLVRNFCLKFDHESSHKERTCANRN